MNSTPAKDAWLFSYGTLQQRQVQLAVFGRELRGEPDVLTGFTLGTVMIADPDVVAASGMAEHLILRKADGDGEPIAGVAYAVTPAELVMADGYETSAYARIEAALASGRTAFVYVEARPPAPPRPRSGAA